MGKEAGHWSIWERTVYFFPTQPSSGVSLRFSICPTSVLSSPGTSDGKYLYLAYVYVHVCSVHNGTQSTRFL